MDVGAITAAITGLKIEPQIQNTVNFSSEQQFDLQADMSVTIPGVLEAIKAVVAAQVAASSKKEQVTQPKN